MKKTIEPFWWSLFGAGGILSAFFIPALLFLFGIAIPLDWVEGPSYEKMAAWLNNPLVKIATFVLISMSLFHWAHRFRFTLYDGLQVKHLNELIAIICYGGAIVGTAVAAYILFL